jgi:hypothetical protein
MRFIKSFAFLFLFLNPVSMKVLVFLTENKKSAIRYFKPDTIKLEEAIRLSPTLSKRIDRPESRPTVKPTLVDDIPSEIKELKEKAIACTKDIDRFRTFRPTNYVYASKQTAQSGNWNDGNTWVGGTVPASTDSVLINHKVDIPGGYTVNVAGIFIDSLGSLYHDSTGVTALNCSRNFEIRGLYQSTPIDSSKGSTTTFTNIDETKFVGGGLDVQVNDIGMWVMKGGRINLRGTAKVSHTNTTGSVSAGATSMTLLDATGIQTGDVIVICPTETMDLSGADWNSVTNTPIYPWHAKFERKTVTGKTGNTISWSGGLSYAHNIVTSTVTSDTFGVSTRTWTPEVMVLTRNVKVQGTSTGRTHIFIRNESPVAQSFYYVELRYMGPRKIDPAIHATIPALVSGRYFIHEHFSGYNSAGTTVYGCSAYDGGNRGYVPHESHRINMSNSVAFNLMENGFWWDEGEESHFTKWHYNIVAGLTFNGIANSRTSAYQINQGDGNDLSFSKSVGNYFDDPHGGGGYMWEANSEGVWIFRNNLSHSEITGLWVWQNTSMNHTIFMYDSYHDDNGIVHGAYTNAYEFMGGHHYKSKLFLEATSAHSGGVRYKDIFWDAGGVDDHCVEIIDSPVPPESSPGTRDIRRSNKFIQCVFRGYTTQPAYIAAGDGPENTYKVVDFINCDLNGATPGYTFDILGATADDGWMIRVQTLTGANHQLERVSGSSVITTPSDFAPWLYGDGVLGLRGVYYNGYNFEDSVVARDDALLMFEVWDPDPNILPSGVHNLITNKNVFSVKWSGFIEPHRTGMTTLGVATDRKRMWITIGGTETQIINDWVSTSPNLVTSSPLSLVAGVKYPIRLEMSNVSTGAKGIQLFWNDPVMTSDELIPPSQLFSPIVSNQSPSVNAGTDITITLPVSSTNVTASASDIDGTIVSYAWSKISGPSTPIIVSPSSATTNITGLAEGIYTYQVLVIDDDGATDFDQIQITVNAAPVISRKYLLLRKRVIY